MNMYKEQHIFATRYCDYQRLSQGPYYLLHYYRVKAWLTQPDYKLVQLDNKLNLFWYNNVIDLISQRDYVIGEKRGEDFLSRPRDSLVICKLRITRSPTRTPLPLRMSSEKFKYRPVYPGCSLNNGVMDKRGIPARSAGICARGLHLAVVARLYDSPYPLRPLSFSSKVF